MFNIIGKFVNDKFQKTINTASEKLAWRAVGDSRTAGNTDSEYYIKRDRNGRHVSNMVDDSDLVMPKVYLDEDTDKWHIQMEVLEIPEFVDFEDGSDFGLMKKTLFYTGLKITLGLFQAFMEAQMLATGMWLSFKRKEIKTFLKYFLYSIKIGPDVLMLAKVQEGADSKTFQDWYNDVLVLDYMWANYDSITKVLKEDNQSTLNKETFYKYCILFKKTK